MPLELIQKLEGHTERVWTLAWNPSATLLATSGGDRTIRLWAANPEGSKWSCVSMLTETHSKSIRRVCWSPCGQYLASASFDSTVCIWKKNPIDKSWSTAVNLEGHENEVKSVAWSHDGNYLASCGRDRTIWIWERSDAADSEEGEDGGDGGDGVENWDCSDVKNDHTKDVKHIVWHPKHNILASCSYDDTVKFFNKEGEDWKCYETLTSHTSTVWSADFSASGEFFVTCSDDRTVRIWKNHSHSKLPNVEANSWKCVSVIQGYHSRTIYDVSWCKSSDVIVSASGDNSLVLYAKSSNTAGGDTEMFTCIDKLSESHECDVNCVAWSQKGLLASGGDDCVIKLWKYSPQEKGMKPQTIVDEILNTLPGIDVKSDSITTNASQTVENSIPESNVIVTDFLNLLNLVQSLQNLQNQFNQDKEFSRIEKLFDLKISPNPQPLELSDLVIDEKDGSVDKFSIHIKESSNEIRFKFRFTIDKSKFVLNMPRRSTKFLAIASELFLFEKTGDMFKILESGGSKFLFGHLFTFADVKFITNKKTSEISYVVSADRDEKIRISNYPDTFRIERYGFGHKSFIRRLILVDDERFISIDQQDNVCLWSLEHLKTLPSDKSFKPVKTMSLVENFN